MWTDKNGGFQIWWCHTSYWEHAHKGMQVNKNSYVSKNPTKMPVGVTFWFPVYPTIWEPTPHSTAARLGRGSLGQAPHWAEKLDERKIWLRAKKKTQSASASQSISRLALQADFRCFAPFLLLLLLFLFVFAFSPHFAAGLQGAFLEIPGNRRFGHGKPFSICRVCIPVYDQSFINFEHW